MALAGAARREGWKTLLARASSAPVFEESSQDIVGWLRGEEPDADSFLQLWPDERAAEAVLPVQFYERRPCADGEFLMLAVVWQAMLDLQSPHTPTRHAAQCYFSVPVVVPVEKEWTRGLDFERVCEHFEWDADAVRRALGQLRLVRGRARPQRPWGARGERNDKVR